MSNTSPDFYYLSELVADFSLGTFGGQRAGAAALKCLAEAAEFATDQTIDEAADVLITLLSWCAQAGRPASELLVVAEQKMHRNSHRTWAKQADGTYQHGGEALCNCEDRG